MAPANKLVPISLLVAFAVIAPALQPSAAIRAEAPAPSPAGVAAALPTASSLFDPQFPCFSFLPPILLQLCQALFPPSPSPSPPSPPHPEAEVKECGSWLARMKPCAAFVTKNATDQEPTDECCDGFGSIAQDGATVCFCRAAVGDFGHILPAPVNKKRVFELPGACDLPDLKLEPFAKCNMKYVPPIDLPSPPPSDDEDTD